MSPKPEYFNRWSALSAAAAVAVLIVTAVPLRPAMADSWKHRGWVGAYYAPGYVYYAPPPPVVYYAPQPVYMAPPPQPIYVAPPPVVYEAPPPAPAYYGPPGLNFGINIPLR